MNRILLMAILSAVSLWTGCIPSSNFTPEQMDRYWLLSKSPAPVEQHTKVAETEEFMFPVRWTIRQERGLLRSTISIVRAIDAIKAGAGEVEFSVSPRHAQSLADLLGETRATLERIKAMADSGSSGDRGQWSGQMAEVLVKIEYIIRRSSVESAEAWANDSEEPLGMAAEPVLEMISGYLAQQSGANLLGDLEFEQIDRLRAILTQVTLKLGFAIAGKQLPEDLREAAAQTMRTTERLDVLEESLRGMLAERVEQAPTGAKSGQLSKTVDKLLSWSPRALEFMEDFMRQWDKMDRVELNLSDLDESKEVWFDINVLPGKEVRLAKVMMLQPNIVFKGGTRLVVNAEAPLTEATVINFEPKGENGGAEMRFEGIIYGLAKLLAFPLEDGRLREIRVYTHTPKYGRRLVHLVVLMEATQDKVDPRRMMVFQESQERQLRRSLFELTSVKKSKELLFSYINPNKRFTLERLKLYEEN